MKHFLIGLLGLLLMGTYPARAQDTNNLITLNDASPAIDIVISLPPDTTGTLSLAIAQAAITLKDAANVVVFQAADPRLHGVDLNLAPNNGSHTLTVERLPGILEAYVSIVPLPELQLNSQVEQVSGAAVSLNQGIMLPLDAASPGATADIHIPAGTIGVVGATFLGSRAATQLLDAQGVVVAQSVGGHVDGANYVLDAGHYAFTVLGQDLTNAMTAGVQVVSTDTAGIQVLPAAANVPSAAANSPSVDCQAVVSRSSVNLRSGPGTGYSILGYAYFNENYVVGGRNPENNWLVVGTSNGSAWLAQTGVALQGACQNLTVFNIPLREAAAAPIIITTTQSNANPSGEYGEHEEHEHENEHEEGDDD